MSDAGDNRVTHVAVLLGDTFSVGIWCANWCTPDQVDILDYEDTPITCMDCAYHEARIPVGVAWKRRNHERVAVRFK